MAASSTEQEQVTFQPLAFYGFAALGSPTQLRCDLLEIWRPLGALGRVYLANTGINAQMIVPVQHMPTFTEATRQCIDTAFTASSTSLAEQFILNIEPRTITVASEDIRPKTPKWKRGPLPFVKLDVRVREELVASHGACEGVKLGLEFGKRLSPAEWHQRLSDTFGDGVKAVDDPAIVETSDAVLIDMRNAYESDIGFFGGALRPQIDSFRDTFPYLEKLLDKPGKDVYMYCTGGIRCEVVSSWMAKKLPKIFETANVYKLDKGITGYVDWALQNEQKSLFKGHEYMFDDRIAVKVTEDPVGKCNTCGQPANTPTNCENPGCHVLFVQCSQCSVAFHGCCSSHCQASLSISPTEHPDLFRQYCKEAGRKMRQDAKNGAKLRALSPLPADLIEKYVGAVEAGALPPLNPELWPEHEDQNAQPDSEDAEATGLQQEISQ